MPDQVGFDDGLPFVLISVVALADPNVGLAEHLPVDGEEPLKTLSAYRRVGDEGFFGQKPPRRDRPPARRR